MRICGLDLSINSSGKCIMDLDDNLDIVNFKLYGYNKTKKYAMETEHISMKCLGSKYTELNFFERQSIAYDILLTDMDDVTFVGIEGYSFGSTKSNTLFQIGEFSGGIKKILYDMGKGILIYPPSVIKYYATENGNADKVKMKMGMMSEKYNRFYPEEMNIFKDFESPQSDLIDAFFICEILRNHMKYEKGLLTDDYVKYLLERKSTKKVNSIIETEMFLKK